METKGGDGQQTDWRNRPATVLTSVQAFVRSHRQTTAIVAVSIITVAVVAPYAAALSQDDSVQPANVQADQIHGQQQSKESLQMSQEEDIRQEVTGNTSNHSHTNVVVNGEQIPVPENGTYNKTIEADNGRTEIKVESSHSSQSSGNSASNHSSVNVNVHSESHSSSSQ